MQPIPSLDRRTLLRASSLLGAGAALPSSLLASAMAPLVPERKTKRVVLVAFAGGVRTRETFGTPANVPTMRQMADEGVLYTDVATSNLGHFAATM